MAVDPAPAPLIHASRQVASEFARDFEKRFRRLSDKQRQLSWQKMQESAIHVMDEKSENPQAPADGAEKTIQERDELRRRRIGARRWFLAHLHLSCTRAGRLFLKLEPQSCGPYTKSLRADDFELLTSTYSKLKAAIDSDSWLRFVIAFLCQVGCV